MKKLLSTILFLLPTLAMAIDKPIPCTGNSCKLLFETTGSGLNSSSGQCIVAWNGSGGVDTCGGT